MANIIYRISANPDTPLSSYSKNDPLTNLEIDGNFKSIDNDLALKAPLESPTLTGTVVVNSNTAVKLPVGTTTQRPAGSTGLIRYNTELNSFEGYSAGGWGSIGGGATGGNGNPVFWENDKTITANYSITSGKNAGTFGPVTIANGVTVTVPDGSTWTIV